MKEVKKVLSAALAATLTTGAMGTVAGATAIDDLYKAAYDATINALEKKDQDSINAAREAINKLPNELQAFKGEFSKQVDTVQHPILVTIVDAINNAEKTLKQVDINAARKSIPANLPEVWRNSYSTGVDNTQQKLIKKATDAADKAAETGKKADLDIAKALLKEISTVENNEGVKTWLATYEKDFAKRIKLTVDSVEVVSNDTIKVSFTREVDAASVAAKSFNVFQTESKSTMSIASVKTSDDKMSVTVKFGENVVDGKEYTVDVKDLKDLNGNTMVAGNGTFAYAKADSITVSINKKMVSINEDLKNSTVVTDNLGRDITKDSKVTFESSDSTVVNSDGIAKKKGQVVLTAVVKDDNGNVLIRSEKTVVEVKDSVATEYQGYSVNTKASEMGNVYSKYNKTIDVKKGEVDAKLVFFFKDQYGVEMQPVEIKEVVEEMTPKVATIDKVSKKIVTISEGTAYFKVKIETEAGKTIEKVVSINVVAQTKALELKLDKANLAFEKNGSVKEQTIKLNVKDQYGDAFKGEAGKTQSIRYQVKGAKGFVPVTDEDTAVYTLPTTKVALNADGEATINVAINPEKADKTGTNTFKVIYELKDSDNKVVNTLEKEFTVSVNEEVGLDHYNVGQVKELDLFDDVDTLADETKADFTIDAVSINGAVKNQVTAGTTVKILDANKEEVFNSAKASSNEKFELTQTGATYTLALKSNTNVDDRSKAAEVGKYTVIVKVGTSEVANYSLTVKDSVRTAKAVTFKKEELNSTTGAAIVGMDITSIARVFDQHGSEFVLGSNDKVTILEGNKSIVKEDGSYDLTIKKVNVQLDPALGDDDRADAKITFESPVVIHVVTK